MKHILFTLSLLAIATAAMASDFTVDKITYEITYELTSQQTVSIVSADSTIQSANLMPTVTHQGITYSVTSIRERAFENCSSLTSIIIPNTVKSIGNFGGDYGCGSTSILGNLPYRTGNVFMGCPSLTTIKVDTSNPYYDSRNNCNAIIETATNTLIAGCQNTFIPNSVTRIADFTFYRCESLTSITIPSSVTSIGNNAFFGTGIYNDKSNWRDGALYINDCLITLDKNYRGDYTIPEDTRLIADWAFQDCSFITSVTLPNSITNIGCGTFYDCTALTAIAIPNGVTKIESYAFDKTGIYLDRDNWEDGILYITNCLIAIKDIKDDCIIKEDTRLIADWAFYYCSTIKSITIPNSVMIIGELAFCYCTSLSTINYTGTMEQWAKVLLGRWDYSIPAKSAICTDGCILLPKSDDDMIIL